MAPRRRLVSYLWWLGTQNTKRAPADLLNEHNQLHRDFREDRKRNQYNQMKESSNMPSSNSDSYKKPFGVPPTKPPASEQTTATASSSTIAQENDPFKAIQYEPIEFIDDHFSTANTSPDLKEISGGPFRVENTQDPWVVISEDDCETFEDDLDDSRLMASEDKPDIEEPSELESVADIYARCRKNSTWSKPKPTVRAQRADSLDQAPFMNLGYLGMAKEYFAAGYKQDFGAKQPHWRR